MPLVIADSASREEIMDGTYPIWGEGLSRAAYSQWNRAQMETPWGREHLRRVALVEGGEVVASAKRYDFRARWSGQTVDVLGIGAVFTPPARRGQGHAAALIDAMVTDAAERGCAIALLFSEIGAQYYERLGFQVAPRDMVTVDVLPFTGSPAMLVRSGEAADLKAIAQLCRARNIVAVADNTFASPWVQRPLELGFDVVVHSTTKYLNGHSDVIGGVAIIAGDERLAPMREQLGFLQNAVGAIAGPFDSFLTLRGIKTLALRMQRHCENALALAQWLEAQPQVKRVRYPGLPSHPHHALAQRQMHGYGGMISIDLATDLAGTRRFLERCQVFALAESLGGVESLIEHPAIMTHATIPPPQRATLGIGDSLVRLSVGVENVDDLQRDLARALEAI